LNSTETNYHERIANNACRKPHNYQPITNPYNTNTGTGQGTQSCHQLLPHTGTPNIANNPNNFRNDDLTNYPLTTSTTDK